MTSITGSEGSDERARAHRPRSERAFFGALMLVSMVLLALLLRPLASALLIAAVFAAVLWPVQQRVTKSFRGRRQLSAAALVFLVLLVIVGPLVGFSAFAIDEAAQGAAFVSSTLQSEGASGLIHRLPHGVRERVEQGIETLKKHTGSDIQKTLTGNVNQQAGRVAGFVGGALAAGWSLVFNTAMMLIALFFLLAQGDELVAWLDDALPLSGGRTRELLAEFKKTSYAIVVSTAVTAAAQAGAALVGYLIARVPHPFFFTAITFFGAFIPAIGAATFTLLAALLVLATGHPYLAAFLAVWAVTAVGLIDNLVKPLVMRGGMNMPGAVVFFALIGGIGAFGAVGLLVGPLGVAFFIALLRMYNRDRELRAENA